MCSWRWGDSNVPEDHIGLGDGRVGSEKFGDGVSVGSGDRGEERSGVEDAGVEEVGRFCASYQYATDAMRGGVDVRRPDLST